MYVNHGMYVSHENRGSSHDNDNYSYDSFFKRYI